MALFRGPVGGSGVGAIRERDTRIRAQFLRFAVIGTIAFLVNATIDEALAPLISPVLAQVLAFPVAATVAWWLNRHFTFGPSARRLHHEWLRYIAANSVGWVTNNAIYFSLVLSFSLAYVHPLLAVAAGSIAGMGFNFVAARWFVFRA